MRCYMMPFKALIVQVAVLATVLTAAGQEVKNSRLYGNCSTGTLIDPILDVPGAYITCGSNPTYLLIAQEAGGIRFSDPLIGVTNSVTKYAAKNGQELSQFAQTEVRFRVDKGDILTGTGYLDKDGYIYIRDGSLAHDLLVRIVNGQRLYLSVARQPSDTIRLNGAKAAAIDMLERLNLLDK